MEEDVADRHLRDLGEPAIHRLHGVLFPLAVCESAHGRDSPGHRGRSAGREIVDEVALQVGVRIDSARHHEMAARVDHSRGGAGRKVHTDFRDPFPDDAHVRPAAAVGVDDEPPPHEELRAGLAGHTHVRAGSEDGRGPRGQARSGRRGGTDRVTSIHASLAVWVVRRMSEGPGGRASGPSRRGRGRAPTTARPSTQRSPRSNTADPRSARGAPQP